MSMKNPLTPAGIEPLCITRHWKIKEDRQNIKIWKEVIETCWEGESKYCNSINWVLYCDGFINKLRLLISFDSECFAFPFYVQ